MSEVLIDWIVAFCCIVSRMSPNLFESGAGVQALALRVIAERLENREAPAEFLNVTFQRREQLARHQRTAGSCHPAANLRGNLHLTHLTVLGETQP